MRAQIFMLLASVLSLAVSVAAQERPNVVVIMSDDQGCGDFGFAGSKVLDTPHLDAMADASTRVEPFYVSPVCAPTRASLMTGRYCYRTRVVDTWVGRAMMDPEEFTVAEMLKEAGYATGIFGKWHLGDCYPLRPQDQGFDEVLVHRGGGIGQPADPIGGEGKYTDPWLIHNGEVKEFAGYCTDVYFDQAIEWIQKQHQSDRPFFCYLPTNAPHGPFHDVPEELLKKYQLRVGDREARIYAMIENIDQNVGKLRQALRALDAERETIVFYLVDNGPNTRRYVRGFRGSKSQVHEGGVRSPLLACWPGTLRAGAVVDRIGAHIDLMPTLAELCGGSLPTDRNLDGRSLWPWLTGEENGKPEHDPRSLVIQVHRGDAPQPFNHFMLRRGNWKLVRPSGFGSARPPAGYPFELYDLGQDPLEAHDLAGERPDLVAELKGEYLAWWEDVSQERPDNFDPPRIIVGSEAEPLTVLTRQDRRVLSPKDGWGTNEVGEWWLHFEHAANYQVHLIFPATKAECTLRLDAGDTHIARPLPAGATDLSLSKIPFAAGNAKLKVQIIHQDKRTSVHQLEIRRLD